MTPTRSKSDPAGGRERNGVADLNGKGELHAYLRDAQDTLVWKLDGLGEYDVRRPLTPTGTNLLGLVKHCGATHLRYFVTLFTGGDQPLLSWLAGGGTPSGEMWALPDEGRDEIVVAPGLGPG